MLKPIKHPGTEFLDIRAQTLNPIQGRISAQFDIIRTVAGLPLPVRCYYNSGSNFPFGSCSYADLCKDHMQDFWEINALNCPPELADFGIDCNCPFNIRQGILDIDNIDFELYDLSTTGPFSFLAIGDFDVTANISDSRGNVANVGLKFSIKPRTTRKNKILLLFYEYYFY